MRVRKIKRIIEHSFCVSCSVKRRGKKFVRFMVITDGPGYDIGSMRSAIIGTLQANQIHGEWIGNDLEVTL